MWRGNISIAEGVNRKAERNVPSLKEDSAGRLVFSPAGRGSGSQPLRGEDLGRRWPRAEVEDWLHQEPQGASGLRSENAGSSSCRRAPI